jgi:hypothetical protein
MIWLCVGWRLRYVVVITTVSAGEHKKKMKLPVRVIRLSVFIYKEMITMTYGTTMAIRAYSRDEAQTDAFEALLDYYGKTNLLNISEEMGLAFLQKLRDGEIRLYDEKTT